MLAEDDLVPHKDMGGEHSKQREQHLQRYHGLAREELARIICMKKETVDFCIIQLK